MSKRFNSDRNPIHLERNGQTALAPLRGPTYLGGSVWMVAGAAGDESKPSENRDKGTKLTMIIF